MTNSIPQISPYPIDEQTVVATITIAEEAPQEFKVADVCDADYLRNCQLAINEAGSDVSVTIFPLILRLRENASILVEWLASITCLRIVMLHSAEVERKFDDLFEACLALIQIGASTADRQQALRCAIVAAAGSDLDEGLAAGSIVEACKSIKINGIKLGQIEKAIAEGRKGTSGSVDSQESLTVRVLVQFSPNPNRVDCANEGGRRGINFFKDDWYLWRNNCWIKRTNGAIRPLVVKELRALNHGRDAKSCTISDVLKNLEALCLVQSENPLPLWLGDDQPRRSKYLALQNGLINLSQIEEGQVDFLEHTPQHFDTVLLGCEYDPAADCPRWLRFLAEVFQPLAGEDAGLCDHRAEIIQEFFGYCLLRGQCHFETMFVLLGEGANGKSTLLEVLTAMLGSVNVSNVPFEKFGDRFRLEELVGKLANISSDMGRFSQEAEGRLKQITSGESIQIDRKYRDAISCVLSPKLIFATNDLPRFVDRSDGIWRRLMIVPFFQQFSGVARDTRLKSELCAELPGILAWAIRGAQRLIQQEGFTECQVCERELAEHRRDADPVTQFVEAQCVIDPTARLRCQAIYEHYKFWAKQSGYYHKSIESFGRDLQRIDGISRVREGSGQRRYQYVGIRLAG